MKDELRELIPVQCDVVTEIREVDTPPSPLNYAKLAEVRAAIARGEKAMRWEELVHPVLCWQQPPPVDVGWWVRAIDIYKPGVVHLNPDRDGSIINHP